MESCYFVIKVWKMKTCKVVSTLKIQIWTILQKNPLLLKGFWDLWIQGTQTVS